MLFTISRFLTIFSPFAGTASGAHCRGLAVRLLSGMDEADLDGPNKIGGRCRARRMEMLME